MFSSPYDQFYHTSTNPINLTTSLSHHPNELYSASSHPNPAPLEPQPMSHLLDTCAPLHFSTPHRATNHRTEEASQSTIHHSQHPDFPQEPPNNKDPPLHRADCQALRLLQARYTTKLSQTRRHRIPIHIRRPISPNRPDHYLQVERVRVSSLVVVSGDLRA